MRMSRDFGRRAFVRAGLGGGVILAGCVTAPPSTPGRQEALRDPGREADVSPLEDLMREHGVLKRVLLIYEESVRRLDSGLELPLEALADAAGIIRAFIEDYHEKLEEDYLFPRFRSADRLVDLVEVLIEQHRAGRRLTERVLCLADALALKTGEDRQRLADALRRFVRMYAPHEAREDTVLFPAFRAVVPARELDELGGEFERWEVERFGAGGFEKTVGRVAAVERQFGLYDLGQFTPRG